MPWRLSLVEIRPNLGLRVNDLLTASGMSCRSAQPWWGLDEVDQRTALIAPGKSLQPLVDFWSICYKIPAWAVLGELRAERPTA